MAQIQRKYDFQPGTKVFSSQVDEEFNNLVDANNTLDDDVQGHKGKQADTTSSDPVKDKHVSNAQAKKWEDHANSKSNPHETTAADVGAYSKQEIDTNHYKKTVVDSKLAQKTDKTGNHEGTWRGLTPGEAAEPINGGRIDYLYANIFPRIFRDGVFPSVQNELAVTESNPLSMSIDVDTGQAWVQGYWYENAAIKEMNISAADANNPRIDRIVLRLDLDGQNITAEVLQGTPAVAPVAPSLTRNDQIYELSLAQVYVGAAVTSIANADITDERWDSSLCGEAIPSESERHNSRTDNPHGVTYTQVGALPIPEKISGVDINTLLTPGFYYCHNCTNTPGGANGYLLVQDLPGSSTYASHVFIEATGGTVHNRTYENSVWQSWKEHITDAGGVMNGSLDMNGFNLQNVYGLYLDDQDGDGKKFRLIEHPTQGHMNLRSEDLNGALLKSILEASHDGIFNFPYQSFVEVDGLGKSLTNATYTKIAFDSENVDTQGEWANNRFTAKKAGTYLVTVYCRMASEGSHVILRLYKNGSMYDFITETSGDKGLTGSRAVKLNAGDYLEVYGYQDSGSTQTISFIYTEFSKLH